MNVTIFLTIPKCRLPACLCRRVLNNKPQHSHITTLVFDGPYNSDFMERDGSHFGGHQLPPQSYITLILYVWFCWLNVFLKLPNEHVFRFVLRVAILRMAKNEHNQNERKNIKIHAATHNFSQKKTKNDQTHRLATASCRAGSIRSDGMYPHRIVNHVLCCWFLFTCYSCAWLANITHTPIRTCTCIRNSSKTRQQRRRQRQRRQQAIHYHVSLYCKTTTTKKPKD